MKRSRRRLFPVAIVVAVVVGLQCSCLTSVAAAAVPAQEEVMAHCASEKSSEKESRDCCGGCAVPTVAIVKKSSDVLETQKLLFSYDPIWTHLEDLVIKPSPSWTFEFHLISDWFYEEPLIAEASPRGPPLNLNLAV